MKGEIIAIAQKVVNLCCKAVLMTPKGVHLINTERKLFVIFDELFWGANVKDAYDALLMLISALAKTRDNFFFISTHILEVAESLENKDSILFKCFELVDQTPIYDFKLKDGVSKERIGMTIIRRENIIGILDQIIEKQIQEQDQ